MIKPFLTRIELSYKIDIPKKDIAKDCWNIIYFNAQEYYYDYDIEDFSIELDKLDEIAAITKHIVYYDKSFENKEQAMEFLNQQVSNKAQIVACRYIAHEKDIKEYTEEDYEEKADQKIEQVRTKKEEFLNVNSMARTQDFCKCPKCLSLLNTKYVSGDKCPLCQHSFLSQTTQAVVDFYDTKIAALQQDLENTIVAREDDAYHQYLYDAKDGEERWLVIGQYQLD